MAMRHSYIELFERAFAEPCPGCQKPIDECSCPKPKNGRHSLSAALQLHLTSIGVPYPRDLVASCINRAHPLIYEARK